MNSIGSILSSIGSAASSGGGALLGDITKDPLKAAALGLAGAGTISNYLQQGQQDALRNKILGQTPASTAAAIHGLEQPLSSGLISGVENQAQGYLGERGLNESPAVTTEVVSQALAPYLQQQQQQAASEYESMLSSQENPGLFSAPSNTSALWQLILGGAPATANKPGATPPQSSTPTGPYTTWPNIPGSTNPGIAADPGWLNSVLGGLF